MKASEIAISGTNNLTATCTSPSTWSCIQTDDAGVSSGKWYWEIEIVTVTPLNTHHLHGAAPSSINHATQYPGNIAQSFGCQGSSSEYKNGAGDGTGPSYGSDGNVLMIALDMDNNKAWLGLNGTWHGGGDPGAGTGEQFSSLTAGTYLPTLGFYTGAGNVATFRLFADDLQYTVPDNFSAYDPGA